MFLQVRLLEEEAEALKKIAARDRRPTRQQAAFLIREALERRGLLGDDRLTAVSQIAPGGRHDPN